MSHAFCCVRRRLVGLLLAGPVPFPMSAAPVVFSATGTVQSFTVPATGTYVLEAAGGEGGASAGPGMRGARVSGMFHLQGGDRLKIVAGRQGAAATAPDQPGSRGGSSLVWIGPIDLPNPIKLLLSARGGVGGGPAVATPVGDPAVAVDASELRAGVGELDSTTADSLATVWTAGGVQAGGDARLADRCGYNAGAFRRNVPGVQSGHGYVSITPVTVPERPAAATPAGPTATPAPPAPDAAEKIPSPAALAPVTPRPRSWTAFFRRHSS